jgi:signal transduction histidine kinase
MSTVDQSAGHLPRGGAPAAARASNSAPRHLRPLVRRRNLVLVSASALLAALLAAFGVVLASSQAQSRQETTKRFEANAVLSAALTASLFGTSTAQSQADAAATFGGKTIAAEALVSAVKRSQLVYLAILDGTGKPIGASPGTPASLRVPAAAPSAHILEALRGHSLLSGVLPGPAGSKLVEWALPFETAFGRRVEVRALPAAMLYRFVSGYLAEVARGEQGNEVVIIDADNRIVASADPSLALGQKLVGEGTVSIPSDPAAAVHTSGNRVFATAPIQGTTWRVLVSRPGANFFGPLSGSKRWVIWSMFGLLALAFSTSLVLFARSMQRREQLTNLNSRLEAMNSSLEQQVAERTADLELRAAQLARSNSELEQFAYIASHDLQEPLRKIQAFGDRLEKNYSEVLDGNGLDYLGRMQSAATRMRALINDLLGFARVTSQGKQFAPVALTETAREAISDLEVLIKESEGSVELGELPTIDADATQMRELFTNLIANALKFRRDGVPPRVRVGGRLVNGNGADSGAAAACEIAVEDNGIGIDEQYADRIFQVFQRLHARSEYEGTGIGLAVCRKIVDRHNGAITVASTPGAGATFTITLPVDQEGAKT